MDPAVCFFSSSTEDYVSNVDSEITRIAQTGRVIADLHLLLMYCRPCSRGGSRRRPASEGMTAQLVLLPEFKAICLVLMWASWPTRRTCAYFRSAHDGHKTVSVLLLVRVLYAMGVRWAGLGAFDLCARSLAWMALMKGTHRVATNRAISR